MQNALFTTTYLLLCFVVLVTVMAVIHLYSSRQHTSRRQWALGRIGRGARLPLSLELLCPSTGFIIIADGTEHSYAGAITAARLARNWGHRYAILCTTDEPSDWIQDLPEDVRSCSIPMPRSVIQELSVAALPAILFVERMRIVEAVSGHRGVEDLVRSFYVFAVPEALLFHPDRTLTNHVITATGVQV